MRKNTKILVGLIVGIIIIIALALTLVSTRQKPNVILTLSPTVAQVKLDNHKTVSAKFYAEPGPHTITVSYQGFTSYTTQFTAKSNSVVELSIVLPPSSAEGKNYLLNNPTEQNNRQKIVGQAFQDSTAERLKKYPVINSLPYVERYFRIDYGQSKVHPADDTEVAFTITFYAPQGKQQGLDWLTSKGLDTSKLELYYVDQSIVTTGGNE